MPQSKTRTVELAEVLNHKNEFITIDDLVTYTRVTAQLHAKGIVLRDEVEGLLIKTKKQQLCKSGDLLVAEIDAKVGGFGIVPAEFEGAIVSSHYFLFEVDKTKLAPEYLDYFIKTKAFQQQISARGSTNYASIRPAAVLQIKMPLPTLNEQKRVVVRLERLLSSIDAVCQDQKHQDLETLWRSLLNKAYKGTLQTGEPENDQSDGLIRYVAQKRKRKNSPSILSLDFEASQESSGLPSSWIWLQLEDLAADQEHSIKRGPFGSTLRKEFFVPSGFKVYEQKNVIQEDFCIGDYYVTEAKFEELRSFEVKPKDIVVSCSGTIGKVVIAPEDLQRGVINQALLKITLDSKLVIPIYFLYLFQSDEIQRQISRRGSAMSNMTSMKNLKQIKFPIPPISDQRRIVSLIENLRTRLETAKSLQAEVKGELNALKSNIIEIG